MAATTATSPWLATLTFAATAGLIGMSFGVLARTNGLSLAMTCGMSLLIFAGPLALGSRTVPPQLQRALTLVSVTLLAALVAISTFGDGRALALDARAAGLGVALAAVWLRAPFVVIVVGATATAALLRALGVG
jgi:branched-subunit amino acid transport protein